MSNNRPPHISTKKLLRALHHALSGSSGTLISTWATYPLSLVVTRLQVQRQLARTGRLAAADEYAGIVDAFLRIWRDGDPSAAGVGSIRSIAALYTGLTTESAKSVLDSFLFFLFYEVFRARFRVRGRSRKGALGVVEELAIGVAAGACSRAFTTPIANVVTRVQTGAMMAEGEEANGSSGEKKGRDEALSVRQIVNSIIKERGVTGLWAGYSATLVLTLNPGITFFLQEFLTRSLLGDDDSEDEDDDRTGPVTTFLLAAVSKATASAIMYPFQTAKARLQAGVPLPAESAEGGEGDAQAAQNGTDGNIGKKEHSSKLSPRRVIQMFAEHSVFWTIAQIARREGVGALYDGMHGDLLKGFFGHGTTMLAKGVMHKLLFKLYLVVAGLLLELRLRRQQALGDRALQLERAGDGNLRALSFMNLDAQNTTTEAGSSQHPIAPETISRSAASVFSKLPTLISRFTAPGNKTSQIEGRQHNHSSPSVIMNIQDRSHRAFDKD